MAFCLNLDGVVCSKKKGNYIRLIIRIIGFLRTYLQIRRLGDTIN